MIGQLMVRRQFHRGELLGRAWVGRVAREDEYGLWLWVADGSALRDIGAADGRRFRDVPFGEWGRTAKAMREVQWSTDMLMLHPRTGADGRAAGSRAEAYSVWFFFGPGGEFRDWYVNLEEPAVRWDDGELAGVDTVDQDLDIVVEPDRSWRWKDEAEFAAHLAHPDVYWVPDPDGVRAEGERVVKLIEAGDFPFDGTGIDFRPDPGWSVPTVMPPGWDRPRAWSPPAEAEEAPARAEEAPARAEEAPARAEEAR
jgi:Protein of unknown function (DUF402)